MHNSKVDLLLVRPSQMSHTRDKDETQKRLEERFFKVFFWGGEENNLE